MKIKKVEKLVANLHDKAEYVIPVRYLRQTLKHAIIFKKIDKVIKFNQNS